MFTVRKQFKFEMGHRLRSAYSACCRDQIHGHSFICEVFMRSSNLDKDGMVIDFGELKDLIAAYVDSWDHRLALPQEFATEYKFPSEEKLPIFCEFNPTAEELARVFFRRIRLILKQKLGDRYNDSMDLLARTSDPRVRLWKVRLHETATGWAEYEEA